MPALVGSSAEHERKSPDEGPDSDALSAEVNISLTEARTVRTVETGGNTEELETTTAAEVTQVIAAEVETG